MLLEDAFVLGDRDAANGLFEDGAVIEGELWGCGRTFVADPRHVLQAHDTALVVSRDHIGVVRRGSDGAWRYVISLLTTEGEER